MRRTRRRMMRGRSKMRRRRRMRRIRRERRDRRSIRARVKIMLGLLKHRLFYSEYKQMVWCLRSF